jgi:tetrahydromethanopterin S-methyltransferase subunit F
MKIKLKEIRKSINEVDYKTAVSQFNSELEKHTAVINAANHYGKTPAEIVKALQMRLSTKGDRNKNTKEVSIDYKDTDSGIKISHKKRFNEGVKKSTSLNEVTVTRIPNFNLESDAYIFMLYLLKNNSEFKKAATNAGIDLFSGANVKSTFAGLHNNLKKVITPQIVKAVVEKINEKRTVIFIDDADIQKGVHTARFAGLLALGVVDSFINDPIDYKLINDLGNAKLKGLADDFSIGRGKIKLGVMLGNKGF